MRYTPLCHSDTEDTEHFLLICPSLKSVRDRHLSVLRKYVASNFGNDIFNQIENEGLTIQFLLDSSWYVNLIDSGSYIHTKINLNITLLFHAKYN